MIEVIMCLYPILLQLQASSQPTQATNCAMQDPRALEVLRRHEDFMARTKRLRVEATYSSIFAGTNTSSEEIKLILARNEHMVIASMARQNSHNDVCLFDGAKCYRFLSRPNLLTIWTPEQPVASPALFSTTKCIQKWIDVILAPTHWHDYQVNVDRLEYVGQETVGEKNCDHVRLCERRVIWELWITAGDAPTLNRIRRLQKPRASWTFGLINMNIGAQETDVQFQRWLLEENVPPATFEYEFPADVQREHLPDHVSSSKQQ